MTRNAIIISDPAPWRQRITIGPHSLLTDEPSGEGGTDAAPNPVELLLAALGACAGTTVQMYARRHAWPLESVQSELCFTPDGSIALNLGLSGALSEAQRQRLFEIAGRCPVHRLLAAPLEIDSQLLPAP